ncbi:MAG TPA: phosphoenolpyruvate synthase [Burkholderiales bacterium]
MNDWVVGFEALGMADVARVGGKNASLGEMIQHLSAAGVSVPGGFATTAEAFHAFLESGGLTERIRARLAGLDVEDVAALAAAGREIRGWIEAAPLPDALERAIADAYHALERRAGADFAVAVRSSATAEDLPEASFAGQQETYLNVQGLPAVLAAVRRVYASLYNDRAIAYRAHHGFEHEGVALSAGIQQMVRSDRGASGVMFTLDTESGFRDVVFITASYGLGETVVQGAVNPDEFYVHKATLRAGRPAIIRRTRGEKAIKMIYASARSDGATTETVPVPRAEQLAFCLTDAEVEDLARQALVIEEHYGRPMDIEWGKDGVTGKLYILQARPETVKSRARHDTLQRFRLKGSGQVLAQGRAIGARIGAGPARVVQTTAELDQVRPGEVLVADMTDPDWEPVMKRAAAIVTNRGGRTCHAAIVARELGIPAVVGCGDATEAIAPGAEVTVSCAEGETGRVYAGRLDFEVREINLGQMPPIPVKIMMNVGNPERAFDFQWLPNEGVGLARLEFIINRMIGVHPKAVLNYAEQPDDVRRAIDLRAAGYGEPVRFYVEKLAEGIATLAAAFHPKPVIVRLSDFKSNEYANLIGGNRYEPHEENPMLGFRGASRYIAASFRDCFELECRALKQVRDVMGFTNVWVMVPFVRTVEEGRAVVELLAANGLKRGVNELKVVMMCEIPSNALLAERFLEHFDGFSIGSNDLTQLTLGLDRDSGVVAGQFDERDPAVKALLHQAIQACRKAGKYVGICGQGPSDHPDLAEWLVEEGIESISLNPDAVVDTWLYLANNRG